MNRESRKILQTLEYAYSGARMMDDFETQLRIANAISAFYLDINKNCIIAEADDEDKAMKEYIDKVEVYNKTATIVNHLTSFVANIELNEEEWGRLNAILTELLQLKFWIYDIPPVEIPKISPLCGEWEDGNHICPICGQSKFKNLDADIWADWKPKYCPNCGSEMK